MSVERENPTLAKAVSADVATSPPREGQTFRGGGLLLRHANLVRLPHTIFALPFALVGVVLASYVAAIRPIAVVWVVVAFTAARFAAMGFNRIVDREIDARNPRTRTREIPSGTMSAREAGAAAARAPDAVVVGASHRNTSRPPR